MALARVLLVEDDNFTRLATATLLSLANFEVSEAANAKTAFTVAAKSPPQVALLDIDLGVGPTGIDVANGLRQLYPNIGIVLLTSYLDPRFSKAGTLQPPKGTRFITKGSMTQISSLTATILTATHYPFELSGGAPKRAQLNSRQVEITRLVATGLTNAEIARQVGATEKSVERTISRVLEKLGVSKDSAMNPRVQLVHAFADLTGKPLPR